MNPQLKKGLLGAVTLLSVCVVGVRARSAFIANDICSQATQDSERDATFPWGMLPSDRERANACMCEVMVSADKTSQCAQRIDVQGEPVPRSPEVADALYRHYLTQGDRERARESARAAIEGHDAPPREWLDRAIALDSPIDGSYWRQRAQASMTTALAVAAAARTAGDLSLAQEVVGDAPSDQALYPTWAAEKAMILGALGDRTGNREHLRDSVARGLPLALAHTNFAMSHLAATAETREDAASLALAWQRRAELPADLVPVVGALYMNGLAVRGEHEALAQAMAVCLKEGIPTGFNMAQVQSLRPTNRGRRGAIEVHSDIEGTILVAPDESAPINQAYERHPIQRGATLTIQRSVSDHPVRFVLRDREDRVRAAAQTWLIPDRTQQLRLQAEAPWTSPSTVTTRKPADGQTRVVVAVIDSGDWRYLRYGFATGQLPTLASLVDNGVTGVMVSDPPSTAVAMGKLLEPSPLREDTPLLLRRLASQYSLALGDKSNALDDLRLFSQSTSPTLTDVVGGSKRVLNMLMGHGAAGPELTGPDGVSMVSAPSRRRITAEDQLTPAFLAASTLYLEQFEAAAAQLDTLISQVKDERADLYLYRYDPTDLLAHNNLPTWSNAGAMKEHSIFFDSYIYLDRRVSELEAALDADDILFIVSDHGTQNSATHDQRSLFVAAAPGIAPQHVDGLRFEHLPSVLAAALCVKHPWPDRVLSRTPQWRDCQ